MKPALVVLGLLSALMTSPAALAARPQVALPAGVAPAASCSISEILASNEERGLDPRLEPMRQLLSTPPYSAYDTFRLIADTQARIGSNIAASVRLTTGGSLELQLKERATTTGDAPELRIDLQYATGRRARRTILVPNDAQPVISFSGEPFEGGIVLVAVTCSIER